MYFQLAALSLGFLGSIHCIGMCGPLVIAMSGAGKVNAGFIARQLLYNMGRVYTYVIMGGVFGLLGTVISIAGFQQWLSIVAGSIILLLTLLPVAMRSRALGYKRATRFTAKLQQFLRRLISSSGLLAQFGFGVINGLLPCGLIYAALAGALAAGNIQSGMGFMLFFGLGTIPALLIVGLLSKKAQPAMLRIKGMIPVMLLAMGTLLILRGMNLGIRYISPGFTDKGNCTHSCCRRP
jgi:sulfite exporter TauE/SafE